MTDETTAKIEAKKPRANSIITTEATATGLVFNVAGAGRLSLEFGQIADAIKTRAMVHGLTQRISDAAAIPRNETTGKSATPLEKFDAMKAIVDHYMSGTTEWAIKRTASSGERTSGRLAMLLAVIAEVRGETVEDMRKTAKTACEKHEGLTLAIWAEKMAVHPKFAEAVKAAEKATAEKIEVSGDALLAEMGD